MIRTFTAVFAPLAFAALCAAPIHAAAQDAPMSEGDVIGAPEDITLTPNQEDDLRCGVVFAVTTGFYNAGVAGFENYGYVEQPGEYFFVETMVDIAATNGVAAQDIVPLVESEVAAMANDPDYVRTLLAGCLYLLDTVPSSEG